MDERLDEESDENFREVRRAIMRKVWKKLKEAEKEGRPITHIAFSEVQKQEWLELKKRCGEKEIASGEATHQNQ
ncbi:MAG: hypothetical protein ACP5IT_10650 [Thermoproteota archaeon]|jgi:hypothetical protein